MHVSWPHWHQTPVTALCAFSLHRRSLLAAGAGSHLRLYCLQTFHVLQSIQAFELEVVHGLVEIERRHNVHATSTVDLLVWGGKSFRLLRVTLATHSDAVTLNTVTVETFVLDRILDGHAAPLVAASGSQHTSCRVSLLNDSNQLLHFSYPPDGLHASEKPLPSDVESCGPPSVLYSGHILPISGGLLVAAGTVYGEVLLWALKYPQGNLNKSSVHYLRSFAHHEGSIFGVRLYTRPSKHGSGLWQSSRILLASCSDDRTVKVYDVSEVVSRETAPYLHPNMYTGFSSQLNGENIPYDGVASSVGHISRVWLLRWLEVDGDTASLVSFGEDTKAQLWRIHFPANEDSQNHTFPALQMNPARSLSFHNGKNIWAAALGPSHDGDSYLYTGGADGRIVACNISLGEAMDTGTDSVNMVIEPQVLIHFLPRNAVVKGPSEVMSETIFRELEGTWNLSRKITSQIRDLPSGRFVGSAVLTSRPSTHSQYNRELLYTEDGDFEAENGLRFQARRSYVYRFERTTRTVSAWFIKPDNSNSVDYLFHRINFQSEVVDSMPNDSSHKAYTAAGYHLCVKDHYDANYQFHYDDNRLERWHVQYVVKGPAKDYMASATYAPVHSQVDTDESKSMKKSPPAPVKKSRSDAFKAYCWLDEHAFILTTDSGLILGGVIPNPFSQTLDDSQTQHQHPLHLISDEHVAQLRGYSMIRPLGSFGALIAGSKGSLLLYRHEDRNVYEMAQLSSKITFLHTQLLGEEELDNVPKFGIVLSCLGSLDCFYFYLRAPVDADDNFVTPKIERVTLLGGVIGTSACFLPLSSSLVIGLRTGALHVITLKEVTSPASSELGGSFPAHGKDAVTAIVSLSDRREPNIDHHILTTGRNGKVMIHKLLMKQHHAGFERLETMHEISLPFGPNIEGACLSDAHASGQISIWGFDGQDFIVWDALKEEEVMRVFCGNAHRNWSFFAPQDRGRGAFLWTQASSCHVYAQGKPSHQVIQSGSHGREIKALAVVASQNQGSKLIATGAEDTDIKILRYEMREAATSFDLECVATLRKHTTGLQQLGWSADGQFLFSSGGLEEFFVWRVRPLPCVGLGVVCIDACPPVTLEVDLRIMDFDVRPMSEEENSYMIWMAYSDSSIRLWSYMPDTKGFTLMITCTYGTACLTNICTIKTDEVEMLLVARADGHFALYHTATNTQSGSGISVTLVARHQVHQNSIKSLAVQQVHSDEFLVITGGDDNALGFTHVRQSSSNRRWECSTLLIPKAHAAAINSLQILEDATDVSPDGKAANSPSFLLATVSNDQWLKVWRIGLEERKGIDSIMVKKLGKRRSEVADVAAMTLIDEGKLIIAGVGLEGVDARASKLL